MRELGINLLFEQNIVSWEGIEIPMKNFHTLTRKRFSEKEVNALIQTIQEPVATEEATKRVLKIADSK